MVQEAKIRVRLDTQGAKKELADLAKMAGDISLGGGGPGGPGGPGGGGGGLGRMFGLGAAFSAGFGMLRAAMQSGPAQIAGEVLTPYGQMANDFFLGDTDDEARGNRIAREQVSESFAFVAGGESGVPQGARNMFQTLRNIAIQTEVGRSRLRGQLGQESSSAIVEGIGSKIMDGARFLADQINGSGGR